MERVTGSEHWIIPSTEVYVDDDVRAARTSGDNDIESQTLRNSELVNYEEFGPLAHLMADPTIEEVWINSPHRVFIARAGVSQLTNVVMSSQGVRDLVERLLMWGGRRLDLSHPFVDARLPDGSRLHVAIPEVTATHWAINIRKHLIRDKSLSDLADLGVMSEEMSLFLQQAVSSGLNILVSGSTQAGKTTLLNALVSSTPKNLRVVTIEEVFELKPKLSDCVALQTRPANLQGEGEIPLRKLIKEALRMRPSQLVVGEIREAEALDLLIALNSGLPGMATIHANSARDAIAKLQTLPLLAGGNISYEFIAPIVASAIDVVVHTTMVRSTGERRILEIAHVSGRIENNHVEIEPLFTYESGTYRKGLLDPFRLVETETTTQMKWQNNTEENEWESKAQDSKWRGEVDGSDWQGQSEREAIGSTWQVQTHENQWQGESESHSEFMSAVRPENSDRRLIPRMTIREPRQQDRAFGVDPQATREAPELVHHTSETFTRSPEISLAPVQRPWILPDDGRQ